MISEGLDALGQSFETVAERVDRSAEAVRERVHIPEISEISFRTKPARSGPPLPVIALAGAAAVIAAGFLLRRTDRQTWTTLRDRAMRLARRTSERATGFGRRLMNQARGTAATSSQANAPTAPVADEVLEERVRSALGRAHGLHVIKVEAEDGIVRVEGRVEPGAREPALAMLRAVAGVRGVEDLLEPDAGSEAKGPSNGRGDARASDALTSGGRDIGIPDELTTGPPQRQ
jgi:hypothetical protein